VGIEGLCFVLAQGRAAHNGPFLLHCYQPPKLSRSVPFRHSAGQLNHYGIQARAGMFETVCGGFGRFRIDSKTLTAF
jgi:hypothetical protein